MSRPWESGFRMEGGGQTVAGVSGSLGSSELGPGTSATCYSNVYTILSLPLPGQGVTLEGSCTARGLLQLQRGLWPQVLSRTRGRSRRRSSPLALLGPATGNLGAQSPALEPLSRSRGGWELMSPVPGAPRAGPLSGHPDARRCSRLQTSALPVAAWQAQWPRLGKHP